MRKLYILVALLLLILGYSFSFNLSELRATPLNYSAFFKYGQPFDIHKDSIYDLQHKYWGEFETGKVLCDNVYGKLINGYAVNKVGNKFFVKNLVNCTDEGYIEVNYDVNDWTVAWLNQSGVRLPLLYTIDSNGIVRSYKLYDLSLYRQSTPLFSKYYDYQYRNKIEYHVVNNTGYALIHLNTKYLIDHGYINRTGAGMIIVDDDARQLLQWKIYDYTWDTTDTEILVKLLPTTKVFGVYFNPKENINIEPYDIYSYGKEGLYNKFGISSNYKTLEINSISGRYRNYATLQFNVNNLYNSSMLMIKISNSEPVYNYLDGKIDVMVDADKYNNISVYDYIYPFKLPYVVTDHGNYKILYVDLPEKLNVGNHKLFIFYNNTDSGYISDMYNKWGDNNFIKYYISVGAVKDYTSVIGEVEHNDYDIIDFGGSLSTYSDEYGDAYVHIYLGNYSLNIFNEAWNNNRKGISISDGSQSEIISNSGSLSNFIDLINNYNHTYILDNNPINSIQLYGINGGKEKVLYKAHTDLSDHSSTRIKGYITIFSSQKVYFVQDPILSYSVNNLNYDNIFITYNKYNINMNYANGLTELIDSSCNSSVYILNDNKVIGKANFNDSYADLKNVTQWSNGFVLYYNCTSLNVERLVFNMKINQIPNYGSLINSGEGITEYKYNNGTLIGKEKIYSGNLQWSNQTDGYNEIELKGYFIPITLNSTFHINTQSGDYVIFNGNITNEYNITFHSESEMKLIPIDIKYVDNNSDGNGSLHITVTPPPGIGAGTIPESSNLTYKSNIDLDFYIGDINNDGKPELVYVSTDYIYIYDMLNLNLLLKIPYRSDISQIMYHMEAEGKSINIGTPKIYKNNVYFTVRYVTYYDSDNSGDKYIALIRLNINGFDYTYDTLNSELDDYYNNGCGHSRKDLTYNIGLPISTNEIIISTLYHYEEDYSDACDYHTGESHSYIDLFYSNVSNLNNYNIGRISNARILDNKDFVSFGEHFIHYYKESDDSSGSKHYYYIIHNSGINLYFYEEYGYGNGHIRNYYKSVMTTNWIKDTYNHKYIASGHLLQQPDVYGTGVINSLTSVSKFTDTSGDLMIGNFSGMNNTYLYVGDKAYNLNSIYTSSPDVHDVGITSVDINGHLIDADMDGRIDLYENNKIYSIINANDMLQTINYRQQYNVMVGENVPIVADVVYHNNYLSPIYKNNAYYTTLYLPGIIKNSTPVVVKQGQYQTVYEYAKFKNNTLFFRPTVPSHGTEEYLIMYFADPVKMIKSENISGNNYQLYMNFTGSKELNYFGIIAEVPVPETIYYPHLYYYVNGGWVDVTNNPTFNFQTIDDNKNGLIDHIKFMLPSVKYNSTERYMLTAIYSNPVICNVTDKKLINSPITASQYAYWNWTVVCHNPNSFAVKFDYGVQLPLRSSEVMLDGNAVNTELENNGYVVHIIGYLNSGANVTHYITFKTPPITVIPTYYYPTKYFVGQPGKVEIKLDVRNWATEPLPNVHISMPLIYGENIKVYDKNGTLIKSISQVSGILDFVIPVIQSQEAQTYIINYTIPVAEAQYPVQPTTTIINGTQYMVKYIKIHSTTPIPIKDNLYYIDDVNCNTIYKIIRVNSFSSEFGDSLDYSCNGTKTMIKIGSLDVGQDKLIKIYYKGKPTPHKIPPISNATNSIKKAFGGFINGYNNIWKNIFENYLHVQYNKTAEAIAWITPLVILGLIVKFVILVPK